MDKLTGEDYFRNPLEQLMAHPDFSNHALRVIGAISQMTTEQLENLNILGGK